MKPSPASLVFFLLVLCWLSACSRHHPGDWHRRGDAAAERIPVCHKGKKTLHLPEPAVAAHLRHGDRYGHCR